MTNASSHATSWYQAAIKEFAAFSLRPKDQDGFFFGFLFRMVAAIVAVAWSSVVIFLFLMVFQLFGPSDDDSNLSSSLLVAYATLISLTVLLGEHFRSRVYERVVRDRPKPRVVATHVNVDQPIKGPDKTYLMAKRAFDLGFSCLVLVSIAPVLLLIAMLIKFDSPGPVFVSRKRMGYRGRPFQMLQFRTSRWDTSRQTVDGGLDTRVGTFLRQTSMDALPQFLNVLRGDMSIVGPRPRRLFDLNNQYGFQDMAVTLVPPGITGFAQVNGWTGPSDHSEQQLQRFKHDIYYINHMSFALDLKIIGRTIFRGFTTG